MQRREKREGDPHHLVGADPGPAGPAGPLPQDRLPPGAVRPLGPGRPAAAAAREPSGGPAQRPHRDGARPQRHHGADGNAPHPRPPADPHYPGGDPHHPGGDSHEPCHGSRPLRHPGGDGARQGRGDTRPADGRRRDPGPPLHHRPGADGPVAPGRGGHGPLVRSLQPPLRPLPAPRPDPPGPAGLPPPRLPGGGGPALPLPCGPPAPRRLPDPRRGRGCAPGAPRPGPRADPRPAPGSPLELPPLPLPHGLLVQSPGLDRRPRLPQRL